MVPGRAGLAWGRDPDYVRCMSEAPDNHQLARQLAVLEERMNTHQATYETALERLERRMAERDAESAKRDKDNLRWQVGLWIAAVVIIGILVRWPA